MNAANKTGQTALILAATGRGCSPEEIIDLLLRWAADPNIKDIHGNTALAIADGSGHADAVRILKNATSK